MASRKHRRIEGRLVTIIGDFAQLDTGGPMDTEVPRELVGDARIHQRVTVQIPLPAKGKDRRLSRM